MSDLSWVLILLSVCMAMFVAGKPRMDVVGLLVIVALPTLGLLSVSEALAGFADPNVLMIAALFVVGEALVRTGVVYVAGDRLVGLAGRSEIRLVATLMISVALMGAFMSSTGIVAIFIPIVLRITSQLQIPPGRLMMPLGFAGLISGMLTLVATPPNMIVDAVLEREGYAGFRFLSFTPIGAAVLAVGVGYMLFARRFLNSAADLPAAGEARPTMRGLIHDYGLEEHVSRFRVPPDSPLVAKELKDLDLRRRYGVNLVAVERRSRFHSDSIHLTAHTRLHANDILFAGKYGAAADLERFVTDFGAVPLSMRGGSLDHRSRELGMAEVLVPPESPLIGKTVTENEFRTRHQLHVLGLRRAGKRIPDMLRDEKFKGGDVLLVIGPWKAIRRLQAKSQELLVLTLPAEVEQIAPAHKRAAYAAACLVLMVALMISGVVPNVVAVLVTCLLLGWTRCVDMESAYKSIHWPSLVLIAGMIPLATALERSGGVELAAGALVRQFGNAGPRAMLGGLFLLTSLVG
ncbi:MAG: SLC13 family permease, partial [Planctomycetaceae bacterium]|nr:SLC13 family permease [Planctomycetaceae bacterium]